MKRKIVLGMALAAAVIAGPLRAVAQGMAVNTSGSNADASAILDVSSTSQGMLVPRMTQAFRTGISSPATGLLVYQTDGIPGFYYNSGTPGTPVWVSLSTGSPTGTAGGDLTGSSYPSPTIAATSTAGGHVVSAINASSSVINPANEGAGSGAATSFLNGTGAFTSPTGLISSLTTTGSGPATYSSGTLNIPTPSGAITSLTTNGTTGAATYSGGTLNIPQYSGNPGTVTSVSSGALTPLFTTSVSNATTTPGISYTLTAAGASTVLTNSVTTGSATPVYGKLMPGVLYNNGSGSSASSSTYYRGDGAWGAPSTTFSGNFAYRTTGSSSITLLAADQLVTYIGSASSLTYTLPTASSAGVGHMIMIFEASNSTSFPTNTFNTSGSDVIYSVSTGNASSSSTPSGYSWILISDGVSKWFINE